MVVKITLYSGLKMLSILKNFLSLVTAEPKFRRCSKGEKKNPKVKKKSVFNDRCITENFPHKVLML